MVKTSPLRFTHNTCNHSCMKVVLGPRATAAFAAADAARRQCSNAPTASSISSVGSRACSRTASSKRRGSSSSLVTGLRATHQLGAIHKLCVTHLLSINQISVGDLAANEYALDWVPLC
jgi:hypothetical protein